MSRLAGLPMAALARLANAGDDEAADLLHDARMDADERRHEEGDPEDSPSLDDPWWTNP